MLVSHTRTVLNVYPTLPASDEHLGSQLMSPVLSSSRDGERNPGGRVNEWPRERAGARERAVI